jgi:hypothetical protein
MARTDELPRFRVAAVQAAPAFLDRERTIDLVETWTDRAAQQGARVVAFPESLSGSPGTLLCRGPFRTVRASHSGIRLKQAL